MNQSIENKGIVGLKRSFIHHIDVCKPYSSNNSAHMTLTLKKGSTLFDAQRLLGTYLDEVGRCVGVGRYGITCHGAWLQFGERKGVVMPWPHLHLAARTNKSRGTGKTISRLEDKERDSLREFWESIGGRSSKIEPLYHLPLLHEYILGAKNADLPGQVFFPIAI